MKYVQDLKNVFFDICDKYDNYEDMKNALRSLRSTHEMTNEDYNYILTKWDEWVEEYMENREE